MSHLQKTAGSAPSTRVPESPVKRRIIEVSAELFAKNGYSATGISELEKAVGLGRGALYHHIESKENLLYEISIRHVVDMVISGEMLLEEELPAEEKLRTLARSLMRTIADNLAQLTVFFSDHRALSEPHAVELGVIRDRFEEVWAAVLRQGVDEGAFDKTDPVIVKGLLGMFNYSYLWLQPGGEKSPEAIADAFSDVVVAGLAADQRMANVGTGPGEQR